MERTTLLKISFLISSFFTLIFLPNFTNASSVYLLEDSTWSQNLIGVAHGSIVLGDLDNDNDLDLITTGCTTGSIWTCATVDNARIYINNGTGLVENSTWESNLTGVGWSSIALGDVDNDGRLDLVVSGSDDGDNGFVVKIYINNGTSLMENTTWEENLKIDAYAGAVALGDVDNDGRLDLGLIGAYPISDNGIYINNGTSFVRNLTWIASLPFVGYDNDDGGHIALGDINNDGRLDMLMVGSRQSDFYRGVYINNGTSLVENSTWETNFNYIFGESRHSIAFANWNNDEYLDFSCIGLRAGDHFYIFQNSGSGFIANTTEDNPSGACVAGYYDGSSAWGDYDNDGDLDIVVIGMEEGRARVYGQGEPNGFGCPFYADVAAHSDIANSIVQGSLAWGDMDNDGDLDLVITGYEAGDEIAKVYINNNTVSNNGPSPPSSGFNSTYSNGALSLSWGSGSDTETPTLGLYYNLRAGTCSSCHNVVSGVYGGGDTNGYFGNMMQRKSITLNRHFDEGQTIYWAVQTIDTGLAKSSWSTEQTHTISAGATTTTSSTSSTTTTQQTTTTTASSSTPPSNGGSPGGGTPTTTQPTEYKTEKTYSSITPQSPKTITEIDLESSNTDLTEIYIDVKEPVTNVGITVKYASAAPVAVPSGQAYKYMEITKQNLDDSNIEEAKISFKVDRSWIAANSIDADTITLNRLTDDTWEKLATTKIDETDTQIDYEATTPGFSYFAITGELIPGATTTTQPTTTTTATTTTTTPASTGQPSRMPITQFAIIVIVIAASILAVFYVKKRKTEKTEPFGAAQTPKK